MRIRYMELQNLQKTPTRIIACIGYFDGVHKGHQELIRQTIAMAEEHHCGSAMITFDPDPVSITRPGSEVHHISTLRQKINLAVNAGIENIFILKFSYEMSRLSPREFENRVLACFNLCVSGLRIYFSATTTSAVAVTGSGAPTAVQLT